MMLKYENILLGLAGERIFLDMSGTVHCSVNVYGKCFEVWDKYFYATALHCIVPQWNSPRLTSFHCTEVRLTSSHLISAQLTSLQFTSTLFKPGSHLS